MVELYEVYEGQIAQIDAIAGKAVKKATPHGWRAKLKRALQAGAGARHRRDVAVELLRDRGRQLHVRHQLAERGGHQADARPLQRRNARGIAVFFITGRRENTRAHTESTLKREGYTTWSQVVLKPDASTASTVVYKSAARAAIEQQGFKIVANVGDQYSDLAGGHAQAAFKPANPFYFLP